MTDNMLNIGICTSKEEVVFELMKTKEEGLKKIQVNSKYTLSRKRHLIVYKKEKEENMFKCNNHDHTKKFLIPLLSNATGIVSIANVIIHDKVAMADQIWYHIETDKPLNTYLVCKGLAMIENISIHNFYTSELKHERKNTKRYDYLKLKAFQMHIKNLRRKQNEGEKGQCAESDKGLDDGRL
jgi:hypothetical protein